MRTILFIFLTVFLFPLYLRAQEVGLHAQIIEDEVYFDPKDTIHLPHFGQNEILDLILNITMSKQRNASKGSSVGALVDDIPFHIPVRIWVYHNDDGDNQALSEADAYALLDSVNRRYAESNTGIQFYLKCNITHVFSTRFNSVNNDLEFLAMTHAFRDPYALNWHLANATSGWVGMANLPWNPVGAPFSFVVECDGALTSNRVNTTVHEIGHTLGLLHTHDNGRGLFGSYNGDAANCFQESVSRTRTQGIGCAFSYGKKCEVNGDFLCDTEAAPNRKNVNDGYMLVDAHCNYTGGGVDNWGDAWSPQTRNYMAYVNPRTCRNEFTWGQIAVMHMAIMLYMNDNSRPWYNLSSIKLSGTVYSGENEFHNVPQRIEVAHGNDTYTINSGATVSLHAGESIILKPGFHAQAGSNFSATVGPLTGCSTITPYNIVRGDGSYSLPAGSLTQEDIEECLSIITKALNREYVKTGIEYEESMYLDSFINDAENLLITEDDVVVFPNPNSGTVNIEITKTFNSYNLRIYNINGALIGENRNITQPTYSFDMSDFIDGMYILQFEIDNQIVSKRIILAK